MSRVKAGDYVMHRWWDSLRRIWRDTEAVLLDCRYAEMMFMEHPGGHFSLIRVDEGYVLELACPDVPSITDRPAPRDCSPPGSRS